MGFCVDEAVKFPGFRCRRIQQQVFLALGSAMPAQALFGTILLGALHARVRDHGLSLSAIVTLHDLDVDGR